MISVRDEVLAHWTDLANRGLFDIDLEIRIREGAACEVIEALRRGIDAQVSELNAVIDATHPEPGEEPPWPGEWLPVELAHGSVAVRIFGVDRLDLSLAMIAQDLERAGIDGEITLCEWPTTPTVPARAPVFECRMLVRGERTQRGPTTYGWRLDSAALARLVDRAIEWLTALDQVSAPVLRLGALPSVPLAMDIDLTAKFRDAIERVGLFDLLVQTPGGFRIVSWTRNHTQLALIDVGATEWRGPRDTFRGFLEESVGDIAYGYVRYGYSPERARVGYALKTEWPPRGGEERAVLSQSATSWWDEYIPDALELQLLGPGFAQRIPPTPSYDQTHLAPGLLLEHHDPAAWYEAPFVGPGVAAANTPVPPILAMARAELQPLLFKREFLARLGHG